MIIFDVVLNILIISWALTFVGKSVIDLYFYGLGRKTNWLKEARGKRD